VIYRQSSNDEVPQPSTGCLRVNGREKIHSGLWCSCAWAAAMKPLKSGCG
jgi:hypothetical protein